MTAHHAGRRSRERGLTLIEITIAATLLAVASMGVAATMMTGMSANREYQENTIVLARAQHYLETMYNLQLGTDADTAASADDLDTVFSGDPEIGSNPPSMIALAKAIDAMPGLVYAFAPPNFAIAGTFQIRVTNNVASTLVYPASVDADLDGAPDLGVATMAQGTLNPQFAAGAYEADTSDQARELFAIEIFWVPNTPNATPELLLRGFRAQDP
ncbi:MAG: prepilin-type N-terminal cleavage/methylation domain-containing protein [Planctomycetota bacterium JB042]